MGAEHFRDLPRARQPVDGSRSVAALDGEHLALREWTLAPGPPCSVALDAYAECFVVPREGPLDLVGAEPTVQLEPGGLAFLPTPAGASLKGAGCRFLVVGWRQEQRQDPPAGGAPRVYRFAEALQPSAPGWRFFSLDGQYLTVGCSYREALPPHREQPHSHDGEQINVALEGRFAFTVGDHTEPLSDGWAALTPRGVQHTGLHLVLPYFQLIFATPPRGRDYAEFLRSIYRFSAPDDAPSSAAGA
jgi:hypothetical protein